jgi:hypothetical protein
MLDKKTLKTLDRLVVKNKNKKGIKCFGLIKKMCKT